MPNIDTIVVCHLPSIDLLVKPVSESKRKVGKGKRTTIDVDVHKETNDDLTIEVKYPSLLANTVLVRKA